MKLCFVAHLNDLSGANRSLVDLVNVLKKSNDITVIVPRRGELQKHLLRTGIKCVVIPSGMWMYSKYESKLKIVAKAASNIVGEILFFFFLIGHKFDDIHFNSSTYGCGAFSCKLLKRIYTWHIRELAEETFELIYYNKNRSLSLIAGAKKIIAISNFIRKKFKNQIPGQDLLVIHNGVCIPEADLVRDVVINGLVFIGAINQDKGQMVALEALNILRDKYHIVLPIYFVGKTSNEKYFKELKEYTEKHNMSNMVHFEGYHKDVSQYRTHDKIVLVCSKQEAFGRVTIEALASQQLIVGNNTGATPEIIIDRKYGYLYDDSTESLAETIFNVINSPYKARMINNSYEYVKNNFSIAITASKFDSLIRSIVF